MAKHKTEGEVWL